MYTFFKNNNLVFPASAEFIFLFYCQFLGVKYSCIILKWHQYYYKSSVTRSVWPNARNISTQVMQHLATLVDEQKKVMRGLFFFVHKHGGDVTWKPPVKNAFVICFILTTKHDKCNGISLLFNHWQNIFCPEKFLTLQSKKREYKISSATATGDKNVTSKYSFTCHLIISSRLPCTTWVKHPVTELVRTDLKKRERMKINRCMPALSP